MPKTKNKTNLKVPRAPKDERELAWEQTHKGILSLFPMSTLSSMLIAKNEDITSS